MYQLRYYLICLHFHILLSAFSLVHQTQVKLQRERQQGMITNTYHNSFSQAGC